MSPRDVCDARTLVKQQGKGGARSGTFECYVQQSVVQKPPSRFGVAVNNDVAIYFPR